MAGAADILEGNSSLPARDGRFDYRTGRSNGPIGDDGLLGERAPRPFLTIEAVAAVNRRRMVDRELILNSAAAAASSRFITSHGFSRRNSRSCPYPFIQASRQRPQNRDLAQVAMFDEVADVSAVANQH